MYRRLKMHFSVAISTSGNAKFPNREGFSAHPALLISTMLASWPG
jgi:hypothetical protein